MGDLSALIFVALAVAWAAYLIPKALRHHAEAEGSRSIDSFSDRMRVLASREPVDRKSARLVPTAARSEAEAPSVMSAAERRMARERARRAAQRRRRVLMLLLIANAVVAGLAGYRVFAWWYVAIPAVLLVAWLVACRLMVKSERQAVSVRSTEQAKSGTTGRLAHRASGAGVGPSTVGAATVAPGGGADAAEPEGADLAADETGRIAVIAEEIAVEAPAARVTAAAGERSLWDPVPMTLPTYVSKPAAARRTIRAIELDSTGVWTSGRLLRETELAKQADAAAKEAAAAESAEQGDEQRAVGS